MGRRFDENDFADIENLIPKKHITPIKNTAVDTSAVYLEFGEDKNKSNTIPTPPQANRSVTKEYTYEPGGNLIKQITVRPRLSPARFYADFVEDAKRYLNIHGKECAPVAFPAYIPEYRSMKKAQLDYYLYFRDLVKSCEKPEAPQSYILLLLFEIINLPNEIEPTEGAVLMHRLWRFYRSEHPRLDTYVPEWLCDYLMIHKIPLPNEALADAGLLASLSTFPEFYHNAVSSDRYTLLCNTAGYTPDTDGRYPETHEYLKEYILPALDLVSLKKNGRAFTPEDYLPLTTGARTAYRSALCSFDNNALISFTYRSFSSRSVAAKNLGDCVKYAENRVRAHLYIRSRLKCPGLDSFEKSIIDDYFDEYLPIEKKRYVYTEEQTYLGENEYLYEPESRGISFEAAKSIEKESWKATAMLEEAFAVDTEPEEVIIVDEAESGLAKTELTFLRLLYDGKCDEANKYAREAGTIPDALAEKINVYAFDIIGDSVIENADGILAVIEDYKEDIEEWLSR